MRQLFDEQSLTTLYHGEITEFWDRHVVLGTFTGQQNVQIHYAFCEPESPRAAIVLSNGRIETLVKYKEFIYDCYRNDIAVYTMDHRGQGLSGRMAIDHQRGYVEQFDDYVVDFSVFVNDIVKPRAPSKPALVCHSMGCAIGYLTASREPELFSRVVFCSPMFGIKPTVPEPLLSVLLMSGLAANYLFGRKPWYAFGQGPYIELPFRLNTLTHSQVRYKLFREEYKRAPALQLGGVTYQWLSTAMDAMNQIEASAKNFPLPTKVLISGADRVVDNQRIHRVVQQFPDADVEVIEGARHELLFESDQYRTPAIQAVLAFVLEAETEVNNA
ncbi:alpha/beta fold hydrolase [Alteromonas sp. ASW11-36]|uniref:Alpha/beta fold hydrolase n=1 Tax=Alteromonas arenosi TaxID=3055817 RepID=A0ABT7T024_9ALTE|nr:alpha/beta fold hydrolase [Alteromonas sp. ASW11-36]MDM7861604.1 alpha/beta fold hydrolase [Alteromonas sp. ASW11-36]